MSDTGRTAVYRAEHALRRLLEHANTPSANPVVTLAGVQLVLPVERKFANLESIQSYCDLVCGQCAVSTVKVRARKGNAEAHYSKSRHEIAIPDERCGWAMREMVILHELAHHLTPHDAGHQSEWRHAFSTLLETYVAPEVGLAFRLLLHLEGVA